jgi:hypothetical protein
MNRIFSLVLILVVAVLASPVNGQIPPSDLNDEATLLKEMVAFNPDYIKLRRARWAQVQELERQVLAREVAGKSTACSHQILEEIEWLDDSTADFQRLDRRMADLKASLADPGGEAVGGKQDPQDGSWGSCCTEWFFKLDSSFDHLHEDSATNGVAYPPRFLDRVNSPEKLSNYLSSVWLSDVPKTGVDRRREFNESLSNLMRLILKDRPVGYAWNPNLKAALQDLVLNRFRNPKTGWWGGAFVRNGHVEFVDSLSETYHVIMYLKGNVPDLPKMVNTLLAVKDLNYPVGWLKRGGYSNHHNMDVVTLLRFGWPYLDDAQKKAVSVEIGKMVKWCATESLQPDGSFGQQQDSIEENTYFGVEFLDRIGYFDKSRRFWTSEEFPEAAAARLKIIAYIQKHESTGGTGGGYYRDALDALKQQ